MKIKPVEENLIREGRFTRKILKHHPERDTKKIE